MRILSKQTLPPTFKQPGAKVKLEANAKYDC